MPRRRSSCGSVETEVEALTVPPGMAAVHMGVPIEFTALQEIRELEVSRIFVLANKSSKPLIEKEGGLMEALQEKGLLAAPLNVNVGMGGGEEGLLQACDEAAAARADCIVTVGGGAIQDAGKLIRLWLSSLSTSDNPTFEKATVKGIQAAQHQDPMPTLPPQIACPNSFAMAELTHVAGITTKSNTKSGAAHKNMMPTVVIFDSSLGKGMPDWVRFGTALRGLEHAVGAVCHPKATEDVRRRSLKGLELIHRGLKAMVVDHEAEQAQVDCYLGGWMAIRALNTGCYPALAHLIQNHYSARFHVHQGSCSGILCARILHHHREASFADQGRISKSMGMEDVPAPRLVSDLVATLPGVAKEHADANVTPDMLLEFSNFMYDNHCARLNQLSPKPFESAQDILDMLALPLEEL